MSEGKTFDHEAPLDDRKAAILRAIVEEYVETAQPVGSAAIARTTGLGVSSATVRNEMTVLEREGYLAQPHTSAGRVPTDRGYRFFVDNFINQEKLPVSQRRAVSDFFASAHRALEDLLHETSGLLARVSRHAAVVVGSQPDAACVRSAQLVEIQPGVILTLVVLSNGAVEREVLESTEVFTSDQIASASLAFDTQMRSASWGSLPDPLLTGDPKVDCLLSTAHAKLVGASGQDASADLYVGGASNLAAEQGAFATSERASRLLEVLEHQVMVVSLVRELFSRGLSVSIGSENRLADLRDCSIVLAPYEIDGQTSGVVGVLGPTRMDYRHALAAVSVVSEQLGRHLS